ncbi:EthD family reductase [Bordetella holmesii]|uniref:Putative N-acetyltransferase YedL n=1 Tax=Bordetella holmesii CDC-H585-BH TaxID=1331206 RepID=A0A158M7I0_9BORD|nr:EthD family reductase [Bordetella holmesii]AMD47150.1 hypothetical protein H558_17590 [Bordetella holmesii H558]AMD47481.1 ethyl tert-butyl ether degradation EthD [Bordetella holmesii F627]AOB36051.1 hypothetical protein BBB42_11345 [Bordetella holmesii]AUL20022.1 hypothetical protein BTL46_11420 [Bordetella holmesii]AUL23359.1 hypothetical protein BTL48_11490 [Bordetella holmesii]
MDNTQYVKRIGLLKRRPDMTMEAFHAHWLNVHAALCVKLPGLERYAVNLIVQDAEDPLGFDGFSELWFKDEAALKAAFDSPEGKTLLADLPNFMSEIRPLVMVEHRKNKHDLPVDYLRSSINQPRHWRAPGSVSLREWR